MSSKSYKEALVVKSLIEKCATNLMVITYGDLVERFLKDFKLPFKISSRNSGNGN